MSIVRSIVERIRALFAWWIADIQRRPSLIGKAASLLIGLFVICCVCSIPFTALRTTGQAVGIVATNTPPPQPTAPPVPTSTPVPTEPPPPTATLPPTAIPPTAIPTDTPTTGPTAPPPPTETPIPPTAVPSFADQVQAAVAGALTRGNRDLERISTVEAEQDGRIYVQWTINDNFTEGFIKGGAQGDLKGMLKALHDSGVSYDRAVFEGSFPLSDALGNSKEVIVVHAEYPRDTVDKINWANFREKNVYVIAENVKLHPSFRE